MTLMLVVGCSPPAVTERPAPVQRSTAVTNDAFPVLAGVPVEVHGLTSFLYEHVRGVLEHSGHSFFAIGAYIPDNSLRPMIFGPRSRVVPNLPHAHADSLRNAAPQHAREARAVAIIEDSIAGPFAESHSGVLLEQPPRYAIVETETRAGDCLRFVRAYRFVEGRGVHPFGEVRFDPPELTHCAPRGFWKTDGAAVPPDPRHRPEPTRTEVRPRDGPVFVRPLTIDSEGGGFHTSANGRGVVLRFADSVVVRFDRLVIRRQVFGNRRRVWLDSLQLAVGAGTADSWNPVSPSAALPIGLWLSEGDSVVQRDVRFVMPYAQGADDARHWIVVEMTFSGRGVPGEPPISWTYAHSERGILAPRQR